MSKKVLTKLGVGANDKPLVPWRLRPYIRDALTSQGLSVEWTVENVVMLPILRQMNPMTQGTLTATKEQSK